MLPGDFLRTLRKCNKEITIYPSAAMHIPSGLYVKQRNELRHICGVDNNIIPERGVRDYVGHILKRGWRDTVEILLGQRIIKKEVAEIAFNTRFGIGQRLPARVVGKKPFNLQEEIQRASNEHKNRHGGSEEAISLDSGLMGDFAKEIQKEDPVEKPNFEAIQNGR